MSSDTHLMARLFAAIRTGEGSSPFNVSLVDPAVLRCTAPERDRMAIKLQGEGYVSGLFVMDGIDNAPSPLVRWDLSVPEVTASGILLMDESEPLRRAYREIRDIGVSVASRAVANTINGMLG